ncbi:restriction endonuclease subunit S [Rothia sp. (in: high G+C Gram-positive bacteria)]|uniref:restriction endonuclease subunit S n=1 Tax=Rothia sp. (in: high G+C Gram-positive bacteria) TaxID=1885016 RepID=UPI001CAC993A|nr:restriction endonuclease subunit S [Rothia sp. (in: high G+C Gram-positive bacteria)]MBF1656014.1 restriction endonuclease subunit S [Rothia sp. (in: high G+C Gram-positive bacteria)]
MTNYIDRLVAELCPDGVEYRPLESLGKRNKGTAITASKMRSLEPGKKDLRIFAAGSTFVDTDSSNIPAKDILHGPAIIVKSRGYIGFEYYEKSFTHKNEMWSYTLDSNIVNQKFIYYYLLTQAYYLQELARSKSVKLPQLAVKDTDSLEVPVPPLEIQEAIVEILDKFTNLEAELEAELEARTLQYEYYRDSLFEALDCPHVPLGSLGVRNKGIAITASKMRTLEPGNKDVRIFAAGSTFVDTDSSFIPDKGILEGPAIIVKSRGHIGFEYYEGKFTHKNELWSYSLTSDLVEQKFIYYYLLTQAYHLHELARGKSVKLPQLAVKDTDELLVPVPSLEEQQRIVDILDRFDALTSSLSEGLPAELAVRRNQYEYYRDQLLSFPRKGENQ